MGFATACAPRRRHFPIQLTLKCHQTSVNAIYFTLDRCVCRSRLFCVPDFQGGFVPGRLAACKHSIFRLQIFICIRRGCRLRGHADRAAIKTHASAFGFIVRSFVSRIGLQKLLWFLQMNHANGQICVQTI